MTTQCGQADGGGTDYDSEPVDDFRDTKDQQADKQLSGERLRTTPGTQSGKKIDGGTNINASVWRRNKQLEHERVGCANLLSLGLCVAESCVQCFCAWDRHTQRRVGVPLCLELLIEGNCTLKGCTDLHPKKKGARIGATSLCIAYILGDCPLAKGPRRSQCLHHHWSPSEELHYRASGDIPRQGRAESQLKPWGEIVQDSLQEGKPVANMNRGEKHQPQRRESRSSVADMTTHDRKENERAERRERHGRKESEREGREKHHRRDRSRSRDRRGRSQHASPDLERVSRDEPDRERRHREKESAHRERRRSTSRQKNESREERGRKVHSEKEEGGKGDRRHRGDRGVSKGREGRSRDAGLEERGQGNPTSPLEIFDFQEEAFRERGASSKPSRGSLKSSGGRALQAAVERGEGRSLEMSERRKSETTGERGSDRTGGKVRGVKEMGSERKVGRDEGKSSETLKRRESVTTEERGSDRAGGRLGGEKEMGSEKREERSGGRSSEKLRRKSEGTGEKGSERAGGWRQEVGEEKERGSEKGGVREGRSRDSEKVDRPSSSRRAVVEPKAHETLRSLLELKNDGKKTAEVGGRERELGDAGRDRSERSLPQADGQLFASSEALGREARLAEIGRKDKASIAAGLNGKLSIGAGLWDTEEEEGKLESPLRQRFDPRRAGDSVRQKRSSEGAQASREGSEVGREALSGVGMEPLRAREDSPASVEAHVDYCSPWESKPRPEVRAPKAPDMATRGGEKSPPKTSGVAVTSGEGRPASGRSSVVENGKRTAPALGVGPHETRSTEQIGVAEKPEAAAAEVLRANGKTGGSTINARENVARGSSGKGAGPVGVEVLLAGANGMQDLDRTAAQGVAPGNGKRVDFGMSARAGKLVEKAVEVQSPAASVQRARMLGRTGAVKVLVGPSRAEEDLHTVFEEASGLQTSTALTRLGHVYSESEDENEGEINVESRDEKESEDKNGGKDENEGKQEKESRDEKESKDKLESEIEKESEDKNESRNEKGSDDEEDDRPLFDRMPAEAAAAAAWHGAGRALPLEGGERVWSAIGIEVLASPPLAAAGEVSQAAVEGGSVEGGDSQEEGMLVDVQRVAEAGEEPGGAGDQEEPVGDEEAPSGSNTFPNLPDPSPKELPEAPMPHLEDPNTPTPVNAQRGSQTFPLADVPQTKGPPSAFTDSLAQTDLVGLATSAGGAQGPKKSGIKIVDVVKVIGPKAAGPVACEVGIGVSGTDAKALPEGRGAVPVAGSGAGSQLAGKQWGGEATSGVELLVEAAPLAEEDQIERPIENGEAAEGQQTGDERPHQREQPSARAEQRTALGGHASQRGMAPGEEQKSWGPPWLKALFEKGWEKECSKEHNTMIRALCIVCAELGSARPVCGACLGKEHDGHNMAQLRFKDAWMLSSDRLRGWGVSDLPEYKYSRESTGVRIWPGPASKRPSLWPGIFICKGCNASAQSTGKEAAAFCSLQCKVQSALSTIPAPNLNDPTASFLQEHPTTANLLREEAGSKASERQSSGHEPEDEADESADGVQARQPEDNIADVIEVVAAGLVHEEGREGMPPDRREAVAAPRITEQAVGGEASDVAGGRTDRVAGGRADMAAEGVRHFFEGAELVDLRPLLVARPLLSPVEEHPVGMGAETSEPERCFQDLGWLKAVFESGWELKGCSQHQRPTAPRLFCVDCFYRQGHERPCCAACSAGAHEGHMVVNLHRNKEWLLLVDDLRNLNVSDVATRSPFTGASAVRVWPPQFARPASGGCKDCGGRISNTKDDRLVFCSLLCKFRKDPDALLLDGGPAEMADALRPADDVIENIASEAREKAAETRVCETAPVSHSHSPWNADWLEAVLEKGWEESCRTHPRGMRLFCTDCAHKPGCERPVCGQCVEGEHEHHRVVKMSPAENTAVDYWLLIDGSHDLDVSNVARRKKNRAAKPLTGAVMWPRESEPKKQLCFECKGCHRLAVARGCIQKGGPDFCSLLCKAQAMRGLNMAPNATVSPEVELADGIEDIGDAAVGIADKIGRSGDGAMEAMPVGQPAGAAAETLDTPETTAADFPRAEGAVPAAVLGPRQRFWGPPWLEAVLQKGWEKPCPRHPQPKNSLPKRLFCLDCAGLRGCERPVCDGCFDKKHNAHKTIELKLKDGIWGLLDKGLGNMDVSDLPRRVAGVRIWARQSLRRSASGNQCQGCDAPATLRRDEAPTFCSLECKVRTNPEKVRPARTDPSPSLPAESRSPTGVPLFETGAAGEIEEVRFKSINALETSGEEPGGFNGRSWRGTSCAPDGAGTVGEGEDFSGEEQVEAAILLEDAPTAERGDEPGTGDVILAQGKTAEVAPEKQATRVHAEGRETENGHGDKETPERLAEAASIDINGPVEATDVPVAGERASDGAAEETGLQPASAGNAPGHELEATGMDAAGGLAGAKAVPPDSPGAELGAGLSDPAVRTMPPSLLEGTGELPASTGDDATGCSGGCSGKTIATAMSDQVVEGTAEGVEEAADNGAGEEVADDVGEEIGAVPAAGQKEGKGGAGGMLTEDASEAVVQNVDDVPLVVGDAAETVGAASEERDPTVGAVGGIAYSSEKIADGVAGELARAPGEGAAEAPTAVDAVATVEKASNGDPPSETPAAGLQRYWGPDWLEIVFKLVPEEGWAKVCSTHKHGRLLFCLDCACTTRQTQPLCADCFDGDHDGHKSVGMQAQDHVWMLVDGTHHLDAPDVYGKKGRGWSGLPIWPRQFAAPRQTINLCMCYGCMTRWPHRGGIVPAFCSVQCKARTNPASVPTLEYLAQQLEATERRVAAGRLAAVAPLGISDPPVGMEADVEEPRAQRAKARRLATEEAELSPREPSIQEPGTEEPGTESPGAEGPGAVHCTDGAAEKLRSLRDLDGEAKIDEGANSRRTESAATSGRTVDAAAAKRALDGFRVGRELPRGTIVFISVAPERVNKVPNFNKKQGVLTEVQPDGNHKVFRGKEVYQWNRSFHRSEMQVMGIPKGLRLRAADFEKGSWDGKMTAEEITNGAGLLDADGRTLYELPEVPAPTGVKKKAGPRRSDASGEGDDVSEGGAVVGKRRNSRSAGDPQGDEGGREMSLKKVIEASDASKKKPRAEAANGAQEAALKKTAAKGSERRVSRELLAIVGNFDLVAQEGRRATRATAGDPAPAVDTGPRRDGKGKRKLDSPVEAPRGKKARTPGDARAQAGAEVPGQESGPQKLVSGGATELVALLSQLGNEGIGLGLDAHAVLAGAATDVSASAGTATLPAEGALQGGGEPGPTIVDLVHDEPSPEDATPTKRARRSAAASEGVPFLGQLGKRAAATKACQKIKQNLIRERIPINDDGELVPPEKAEPSHRAASKARPVLNWETRPQVPIAPRLPTMHPAGPRFLGSGRVAPAGGVHPGQMHPPAGAQTALPSTGRQPEFRLGDPVGEPFASQLLEFTFSVPRDSATDRPVVFVTSTRPYVGGHMKAGGAVILDQSGWQLHQMAYPAVVLDHSARTAVSLLPVPVPLPGSPMASVSGGPLPPQNGAVRKSAAPELQASASAAPAIRSPLVIPSPQTSHQEPVHAPRFLQNGAPSVSPMLVARPVAAPVPTPERTPTPGPSAGSPAPEEVGGSWGKRKSPGNVACLALGAPTGGKRQKVAEEELSPVAGIPEVRSEELGGAAEAGGHVAEGIGTPMPSDPVSVPPPPAVSTEPPESSASQLGFGPLGIEAVPSQGTEPQGRPKRKVTSQVTAPPAAPRRAVMRTRPMRGGSFPSEKIIVAPEAGRSALSGGVKAGTPGPQQTHQAGVEPPPAAGPPALPVKKRIGRPPKRKLDEAEAAAVADVTTGALGADVSKGPSSGADVSKGPSGDSDVDTQAALPAAHTPQKKRSQKGKRPREEAGAAGGAAANVSITPADVSMTEAAIVAAPPVPKATSRGKGKGLQQQQAGRSMSAVRGGPAQTAIVPRGAVSAVGQGGAASNGAANGRKLVAGRGGGPLELPKFLLDSSDEESDDEEDDEEEDHGPPEELMAMCKLFDEVQTDYHKIRGAVFYLHYLKGVTMTKDLLDSSQVDVRVRALMNHVHAGVRNHAQKLWHQWAPLRKL